MSGTPLPLLLLAGLLLGGCVALAPEGCGRARDHSVEDASPFPKAGYRSEGTQAGDRFVQTWTVRASGACANEPVAARFRINVDHTGYQGCAETVQATGIVESPGRLDAFDLLPKDDPGSPWIVHSTSAKVSLQGTGPLDYTMRLEVAIPTTGDLAHDQACIRELVQGVSARATDRVAK